MPSLVKETTKKFESMIRAARKNARGYKRHHNQPVITFVSCVNPLYTDFGLLGALASWRVHILILEILSWISYRATSQITIAGKSLTQYDFIT